MSAGNGWRGKDTEQADRFQRGAVLARGDSMFICDTLRPGSQVRPQFDRPRWDGEVKFER